MKTPMGSLHKDSTHATGRRRVEVEWSDPGPQHLDVPNGVVENAVRLAIREAGGGDIEVAFYDERGTWERRRA